MKLFCLMENKILSFSFQKVFFILLGLMIVKVGIWEMPNLGSSFGIAQNPFINAFLDIPEAQYLMCSWLSSFVAWLFHLNSLTKYFLFHLACSIGFVGLFAKGVWLRYSEANAKKALILFFLFPFSATAFFWVGMDSATLLLMLLSLYFFENTKWAFCFACLLGLQHFEQGLVSALALIFPAVVNQYQGNHFEFKLKHAGIYLLGIVVGKLILFCIFQFSGIELVSNRTLLAKANLKLYMQQFFFHFQAILWSIFGVGWFLVLHFYQIYRYQWAVLLSILGVFMCITPMIGDQTRVDCITLFPLIWVFLFNNKDFIERLHWRTIIRLFLLWLMIPWMWVWGVPKWSVFPYDVYFVLHKLFHHIPWPENAWIWPFS